MMIFYVFLSLPTADGSSRSVALLPLFDRIVVSVSLSVTFVGLGSLLQFGVIERNVAAFTCSNSHCILYRDYKDAAVTDLSSTRRLLNGRNRLLNILVTYNNVQEHSLDAAGIIHHTTVDTGLTHLAFATHIIVGEPLDVGSKQCFLHIIKLRLANDCFDFLPKYLILNKTNDLLSI